MVGAVLCLNLSVYSQLISLKMNDVSVKKAMMELQTKSGFSFVYIAGDLDIRKMVTIDANQLDEAINQILKGQNVSYVDCVPRDAYPFLPFLVVEECCFVS